MAKTKEKYIKVPESVIQEFRDKGMEAALKKAESGKASAEYMEGIKRFYPSAHSAIMKKHKAKQAPETKTHVTPKAKRERKREDIKNVNKSPNVYVTPEARRERKAERQANKAGPASIVGAASAGAIKPAAIDRRVNAIASPGFAAGPPVAVGKKPSTPQKKYLDTRLPSKKPDNLIERVVQKKQRDKATRAGNLAARREMEKRKKNRKDVAARPWAN